MTRRRLSFRCGWYTGELLGSLLPVSMTRVRFAPAPTGFLHIGGARTYIFNWLFARQRGGKVVLRIDDTDTERSTKEAIKSIISGLLFLELPWDESYYQSGAREFHDRGAEQLLACGAAYRDFTAARGDSAPSGEPGAAPWLSNPGMRELSREESGRRAQAGEPFVLRFRAPRESGRVIEFEDMIFGKQSRKVEDIEDFALRRSDGSPTYHLASCVDDRELEISHVIRGQDHLTNTFKHILLFEALDCQPPAFGHLPLLLGPDGSKLSKRRHGPIVSLTTYRDRGFLGSGLVNYLSLLGWSAKDNREILTPGELLEAFSLDGIQRGNAVVGFDESDEKSWADPKALWINSQHLRAIDIEDLVHYVEKQLIAEDMWIPEYVGEKRDWLIETVDMLRARFVTLRDFVERGAAYFSDEFAVEPRAGKNLARPGARGLLRELAARLKPYGGDAFTEEKVEKEVRELAAERGAKPGLIINAARAALTGQSVGPSAFAVFAALGRERVIERLERA